MTSGSIRAFLDVVTGRRVLTPGHARFTSHGVIYAGYGEWNADEWAALAAAQQAKKASVPALAHTGQPTAVKEGEPPLCTDGAPAAHLHRARSEAAPTMAVSRGRWLSGF